MEQSSFEGLLTPSELLGSSSNNFSPFLLEEDDSNVSFKEIDLRNPSPSPALKFAGLSSPSPKTVPLPSFLSTSPQFSSPLIGGTTSSPSKIAEASEDSKPARKRLSKSSDNVQKQNRKPIIPRHLTSPPRNWTAMNA
jgi:hypothetical protein